MDDYTKKITVRLTDGQYDTIKTESDAAGLSVSDFVRRTAVTGLTTVAYDPEMTDAVSRLYDQARSIANDLHKIYTQHRPDPEVAHAVWRTVEELKNLNGQMTEIVNGLHQVERKGADQ